MFRGHDVFCILKSGTNFFLFANGGSARVGVMIFVQGNLE